MKHIESNAELRSNSLLGWLVANPTRQNMRHIKKIAPGTIPSASGLISQVNIQTLDKMQHCKKDKPR